jgi:hypothetical protein
MRKEDYAMYRPFILIMALIFVAAIVISPVAAGLSPPP